MIDLILKTIREQKAILLLIIGSGIILGVGWGVFIKKEKVRIREINPKNVYRERVLSEIKDVPDNQDMKPLDDILEPEKSEDILKPSKKSSKLPAGKKRSELLDIDKTPINELLEDSGKKKKQ